MSKSPTTARNKVEYLTPRPVKQQFDNTIPRKTAEQSSDDFIENYSKKEGGDAQVNFPKDCLPLWSARFIKSSHRDLRRPGSIERKLDTNYSQHLTPPRNKSPITDKETSLHKLGFKKHRNVSPSAKNLLMPRFKQKKASQ